MDQKPRAVIFDLDGTLAQSKQAVAPVMAELLVKLAQQTAVAVISGGSWNQFRAQLLAAYPAEADFGNLYLFPINAAQCYAYKEGSWEKIYDNSFTSEERATIMAALREALEELSYPTPPQLWGEQIEDRGGQVSFSPLGQQAPLEEKKKWRASHDKERSALRDTLSEKLPTCSVRTGGETTIDITRKGVTKAYGLERLSGLINIPISEMVYVGDALQEGGNDSVVIETGVQTQAVQGPEDTAVFIQKLIS